MPYPAVGHINARGEVAVDVLGGDTREPAIWDVAAGEVTKLRNPDEEVTGRVIAINNAGDVLVEGSLDGKVGALLWSDGEMVDLTRPDRTTRAIAVNDPGHVIGRPGFLWRNGEVTDLGSLGGTCCSPDPDVVALNNKDQVVGKSAAPTGKTHAFLWEDGEMIDIGALAGGATWVIDINDNGQILGRRADEFWQPLLWTVQSS